MLLPSSSTLIYDLNLEFTNNHTQKHYTVKAKNAVTTWMQILLFPALPFSWIGSNNMLNDIADYSYDELRKQDAFTDTWTKVTKWRKSRDIKGRGTAGKAIVMGILERHGKRYG